MVYNKTQRSKDYSEIADYYRPGHADYTFDQKYGFRDYRGGGRSSGRETIGRVAAGAIAEELLKSLGIQVQAYTKSIGDVTADMDKATPEKIMKKSSLYAGSGSTFRKSGAFSGAEDAGAGFRRRSD